MVSWQAWSVRLGAALFAGLLSTQTAWAGVAPSLSFSASANPAVVGTSVNVDVRITDVTDLYAYQFSLNFNPAVLQVTGATEGSFLTSGGATTFFSPGTFNNTLGKISFAFDSIIGNDPGITGDGLLVRYTFNAVAVGTSALTFGDVLLLNSALSDITVFAQTGSLQTVAAIPEPETLALFGLGLAAVALARRRRAA